MPFFDAPVATAAFTADGTSGGYVTVADNSSFYPGATCWIHSATVDPKQYVITDLVGSTKIGVREILPMGSGSRTGRTPISQYAVANSARIDQEATTVRVEVAHVKLPLP